MDTSGFFKNDSGMVLNGPNFVLGGSYSLYKEQKDTYTYPVEGWYWFDSEEELQALLPVYEEPII